jgi:hypothetical protein
MSDTPETDANSYDPYQILWDGSRVHAPMEHCKDGDWVPGLVARRLERERDELLAANSELVKCLQSIRNTEFQQLSEGMKAHLCQILNRHYTP